jgi:membrane protease YdiL (CAAX protease family)
MTRKIVDNLAILITLTLINLYVLFNYIRHEKTIHGIGYFLFFYCSMICVYFFTKQIPAQTVIEIKNPKKEFKIILLFTLIGVCFISVNFYLKSLHPNLGFLIKLPMLLGIILFTYPLGICIFLLFKKYKISQFGIKVKPLSYLLLGISICALTGLFAFLFNRDGILWEQGYKEYGGVLGILLQGIIGAALVEELLRFFIQTRFEKIIYGRGFHILFATTIWAFIHFPVTYYKNSSVSQTLIYCVQIIPIGFVWGYLSHRAKSILPSVIVHGLNMWGLQNG